MSLNIEPNVMYALIIILVLLAVATFLHFRRHQSDVLERHFGPEYKAEAEAETSEPAPRQPATPNSMRT